MRKIEVCCSTLADVREARAGGAIRVELCAAVGCGGVTPSYGLIEAALAERTPSFAVNVLIRPREGSFLYSADEVAVMLRDIELCRRMGADGVVVGALTPSGDVDMDACRRMIDCAEDMSVTFHRAFDVCRNPQQAFESIMNLGCDRLLTSGCKPSAEQGAPLIASLVEIAAGRITVMAGAGVTPSNIVAIERITRAAEFHSTARITVPDGTIRHNGEVSFADDAGEGFVRRTDRSVVSQLVNNTL